MCERERERKRHACSHFCTFLWSCSCLRGKETGIERVCVGLCACVRERDRGCVCVFVGKAGRIYSRCG